MRAALLILEDAWPGFTPDREAFEYLGARLFAMGLDLVAFSRVLAEPALAEPQLAALYGEADFLVVVGGFETQSQVQVKEILKERFGATLAVHEALRERTGRYFGEDVSSDDLDRLATMPETSLVLSNRYGPVAGFFVDLMGTYFLGLPREREVMEAMLEEQVSPLLESMEYGRNQFRRSLLVRLAGRRTDKLEEAISGICGMVPGLTHSFLTLEGEVLVRLTADGVHEMETELLLQESREMLRARLGAAVYGVGSDTLEKVVAECLAYAGRTIMLIDGLTGGLMPYLLAHQAGAEKFLKGARVLAPGESAPDIGKLLQEDDADLALAAIPGDQGRARIVLVSKDGTITDETLASGEGGGRPRYISYQALDAVRHHLGWEGGGP